MNTDLSGMPPEDDSSAVEIRVMVRLSKRTITSICGAVLAIATAFTGTTAGAELHRLLGP